MASPSSTQCGGHVLIDSAVVAGGCNYKLPLNLSVAIDINVLG